VMLLGSISAPPWYSTVAKVKLMLFKGWSNLTAKISRWRLLSYKYLPENWESFKNVVLSLWTEKAEPEGELKEAVSPADV